MKHSYLREESYYQDIYDHIIVDECLKIEKEIHDEPPQYIGERLVTSNIDEFLTTRKAAIMWVEREETIWHMMDADKRKDALLVNTQTPKELLCRECNTPMRFSYKTIKTFCEEKLENHVLFIFHCDKCKRYQGIYDSWASSQYKSEKCPECKKNLDALYVEKRDSVFHVSRFCKYCHYHDEVELDVTGPEDEIDLEFERNRKRFCFSRERAEKHYAWFSDLYGSLLKQLGISEQKRKQKPLYDRFSMVKRMNVNELKLYLDRELSKFGYIWLRFENPDISGIIRIGFTIMDQSWETDRYKITKTFRAKLKSLLEDTNWGMWNSERLQNRLWILSGQLRGIDSEDVLLMRTEEKMKKNGEKTEL